MPNLAEFNCRVELFKQDKDNCAHNAFGIEICGSIRRPAAPEGASLRISLDDITDENCEAQPVHSRIEKWHEHNSPVFVYSTSLGKLSGTDSVISDWLCVAKIYSDWLILPRKGKRILQFNISLLSDGNCEEFAFARSLFDYENTQSGYEDLAEGAERAKTLGVALAFSVSAVDKKLYKCEIELIKKWALGNIDSAGLGDAAARKLEKALDKTVKFFRKGQRLDNYKICKEIAESTPAGQRYDILDLCLRVARANGTATVEEVSLLSDLAKWLQVDMESFRAMLEKILPANIHEVKDAGVILGVTCDMDKDETLRLLNNEYRKWNGRVTNIDPEIQVQAEDMLELITQTRNECLG